jgi:hypothetical protein
MATLRTTRKKKKKQRRKRKRRAMKRTPRAMRRQLMSLLQPKEPSRLPRRLLPPRLQSPRRLRPVVMSNTEEIAYLSYSNSFFVLDLSTNIQIFAWRIFCE